MSTLQSTTLLPGAAATGGARSAPNAIEPQQPIPAVWAPIEDKVETGNIHGIVPRLIYGAALYGLPALAAATMGPSGMVESVALGAGLGAVTHPSSAKDATLFGVTGALVGGMANYLVTQAASAGPYGWIMAATVMAVGAGTQALFSLKHE